MGPRSVTDGSCPPITAGLQPARGWLRQRILEKRPNSTSLAAMARVDRGMVMERGRVWPMPWEPQSTDVPLMWNIRPWHGQLLLPADVPKA